MIPTYVLQTLPAGEGTISAQTDLSRSEVADPLREIKLLLPQLFGPNHTHQLLTAGDNYH